MAAPGDSKTAIETPALCLDLDRFEQHLKRSAATIAAATKIWRPHTACHHSAWIAQQQVQSGAIGVTCAAVSDAEAFADAGILDILITRPPVSPGRCERLARLCQRANPIVACDHYVQAQAISSECVKHGSRCRVLVELNVGMERTGVRPGRDAIELGKGVDRLPGLKLAGIMGYAGHVRTITDPAGKIKAIEASAGILSHTRTLYHSNGLCCDIISGAGSDALNCSLNCEAFTEIQAGSVIFGNVGGSFPATSCDTKPALTVLSTVISRPGFELAVLDAGRNAIPADCTRPLVDDWPDATVLRQTAEHTVLQLGPVSRELRIGDRVELIVNSPEITTPLHQEILGFRHQRLETILPINARGNRI